MPRRSRSSEPADRNPYPRLLANESLPPEPRQERSRRAREALLRAALYAFERQGYEAATIAGIARRAKVAVGAFYTHFRTKRQALLVLMDRLVVELAGVGPPDLASLDRVHAKALVVAVVHEALRVDRKYAGVFRAWREAVLADEELATMQAQIDDWSMNRLVDLIEFVRNAPGARPGLDTAALARVFHALFWRLAEQRAGVEADLVQVTTAILVHALFEDAS